MAGVYDLKPGFVAALSGIEDRLAAARVTPTAVTLSALPVAAASAGVVAAGASWHPLWWVLVAPLAMARLALQALDGSLARRTGRCSRRGAVANELVDRASDVVMIGALGLAASPALAASAVAAALLVSLTGVLAQALDGQRLTGGPMGKADRMAVLALAALAAPWAGTGALTAALWVMLAGSLATFALRARGLLKPGEVA